jgi:hypothetical protein
VSVESLRVYQYAALDDRYHGVYDFQWKSPAGEQQGIRVAVAYAPCYGREHDVFRRILPFGTIALRCCAGGQPANLRAEYRLGDGRNGDNSYELPIVNGDERPPQIEDHCDGSYPLRVLGQAAKDVASSNQPGCTAWRIRGKNPIIPP